MMRESESKKLDIGDRVIWADLHVSDTVIDTGYHAITVQWDDGQIGTIHHRDAHDIARDTADVIVSASPRDTCERCRRGLPCMKHV